MTSSNASHTKPFYELLSSMRFAISLFTLLAIASVIGTVLKQNQPYTDYVIKFGQFWFTAFRWLGLFDVYHTVWFVSILFFLVLSTSACIYRNLPGILRDMRSFRVEATEQSLRNFHHRAEWIGAIPSTQALEHYLTQNGYTFRERSLNGGTLLAAKRGNLNRLGYLFTHSAIVFICIGGLIDGNLPLQIEQAMGIKHIETRDIPESEVPAISRLTSSNLSFRGNVTLPENDSADVVFLNIADGYMVQELPFRIALKKFHIEHYSTGQPKTFASDVVLLDKKTGQPILSRTIQVNHPLIYDGIAIYQSSFGDGGSKLALSVWPLDGPQATPTALEGTIHENSPLQIGQLPLRLEFKDFHPFNIETIGQDTAPTSLGGNAVADHKNLRNAGPSFEYKIRFPDGQAREYDNYMLPVQIDNRWFMATGMRTMPNQPYRYLRMPLDPQSSLDGFMRLRAALMNPDLYPQIAQNFSRSVLPDDQPDAQKQLETSTIKELAMFSHGGYPAISDFIEHNIPANQREQAAQAYLKILELSAWQAWVLVEAQAHQPTPTQDDTTGWFLRDSLNAINDIQFYGAPIYLELNHFNQVQSSGLQLTRSPGKNLVFLGSALLVLGIFTMFFIQERRLWLLVKPGELLLTMSSNRQTIDFENEFLRHQQAITQLTQES